MTEDFRVYKSLDGSELILADGGFASFAMAAHCVFNGEVITTYQHTGTEKIAQAMDEVTGAYWGAAAVVSRDKTKRRSVHAVLLYKTANGSDKDQITKTVRAFLLHAPTLKHLAYCNTITVRIDQTDDMVFPGTEKQQSEIFGQIYRQFHEAGRA